MNSFTISNYFGNKDKVSEFDFFSKPDTPKKLLMLHKTESLLLQVARCPILCSQVVGYLPLTRQKKSLSIDGNWSTITSLKVNLCSYPFLWSIILIIGTIGFLFLWKSIEHRISERTAISNSDAITITVIGLVSLSYTFLLRIYGILTQKKVLNFWKINCKLIHEHFGHELTLPMYKNSLIRNSKKLGLYLLVVPWLSICGTLAAELVPYFCKQDIWNDTKSHEKSFNIVLIMIATLIWTFIVTLHPFSCSWMFIYIRIYSHCLSIVRSELKELTARNSFPIIKVMQDVEDKKLRKCIRMYKTVVELVKMFESQFGARILFEITYAILIGLGISYFFIIWGSEGNYTACATNVVPIFLTFSVLYHFAEAGSDLSLRNLQVLDTLENLPVHEISFEMQLKVSLLRLSLHSRKI